MEDRRIIELYWDRDEQAIPVTAEKYGSYCAAIARNILDSDQDAEECLNDVWLRAWNAMPPQRPQVLSAFLGKITRNLALNRRRDNMAGKRGGGQVAAVLDELTDCFASKDGVEETLDRQELLRAMEGFLRKLPDRRRVLFIRRYWYLDSVGDIARRLGMTENHVSVTLSRLRRSLRDYLTERGFEV